MKIPRLHLALLCLLLCSPVRAQEIELALVLFVTPSSRPSSSLHTLRETLTPPQAR
jgi:hypothetical protein